MEQESGHYSNGLYRFRVYGSAEMEKKMGTTTRGYVGTTIRIYSFIPS